MSYRKSLPQLDDTLGSPAAYAPGLKILLARAPFLKLLKSIPMGPLPKRLGDKSTQLGVCLDASDPENVRLFAGVISQMDNIAEEVRSHRKRLGLTLQAFSKRLGVSLRAVQYWEAGTRTPGNAALTLMKTLKLPRVRIR